MDAADGDGGPDDPRRGRLPRHLQHLSQPRPLVRHGKDGGSHQRWPSHPGSRCWLVMPYAYVLLIDELAIASLGIVEYRSSSEQARHHYFTTFAKLRRTGRRSSRWDYDLLIRNSLRQCIYALVKGSVPTGGFMIPVFPSVQDIIQFRITRSRNQEVPSC